MVNKQYTVQKQQQQHQHNSAKRYSPPPVRNSSIISNTPNPIGGGVNQPEELAAVDLRDKRVLEDRKFVGGKKTAYGRNITLDSKIFGSQGENIAKLQEEQKTKDHLEINDIGRFQYILQMDKEMGTHPDSLYRVPPRIHIPSSTVSSSSINSTNNHINFWKAGSESPMTATSTASVWRKRCLDVCRQFKHFWKYVKWLLLLILCFVLLGTSIYFLVSNSSSNDESFSSNHSVVQQLVDNGIDAHVEPDNSIVFQETTENSPTELEDLAFEDELDPDTMSEDERSTDDNKEVIAITSPHYRTHNPTTWTTMSPSRNTQILQIYTRAGFKFDDDLKATTEDFKNKENASNEDSFEPTKDTFGTIGFTSGHQNNFGVPIEEDERILKILNESLNMENQTFEFQRPTTDATINRPHVSPTLPVISRFESTTEQLIPLSTDSGDCHSTSLSICRHILQYDLTVNRSRRALSPLEQEHFKYLFDSKCSARAAEFVCSALEPECRPTQMGTLRPCKRICKSILEPCASIIASSEVLTTTFDCDSYPDSSDRNVCEDPTRRSRCYDNEFKCLDSTCIPLQWKCDNIKDCSLGEDEDNCLFCEHDEFRCQSSDKCIPDKWRCDQYNDCPDGSDETDCYDYEDETENVEAERNLREFAFASVQAPDSPKNKPYLTISSDDEQFEDSEEGDEGFLPSALADESQPNDSHEENEEIQKGEASGRVVVGVPKNLANFQDSKEIMMTSDSETDFKYSKINQTKRSTGGTARTSKSTSTTTTTTTSTTTTSTTTARTDHLTPGPNQCPDDKLRCISGKCITVEQICDKTIDCPDGADEAMCVYKD